MWWVGVGGWLPHCTLVSAQDQGYPFCQLKIIKTSQWYKLAVLLLLSILLQEFLYIWPRNNYWNIFKIHEILPRDVSGNHGYIALKDVSTLIHEDYSWIPFLPAGYDQSSFNQGNQSWLDLGELILGAWQ